MAIGGAATSWKHGTNGAVGALTDFTAKTMAANLSLDAEEVDATVFGDSYRDFEQSFKNATIDATYKYDTTVWGQLAAIYNGGDIVIFELGPTGAVAPQAKITGSIVMTKLGSPIAVGDLIKIEVSWRVTGAVTFGAFA